MYDNHTYEDLLILQSLPLNVKVRMTQTRIREWVKHWGEDKCYISFSGGKDSTVLLHLVRELYPDIPAIFSNTGLEYPEIQSFAKSFDNVEVVTPKKNFKQILTEYGYPVISKEVSEAVMYARRFVESVKNGGRNKYQYAFDRFYGLGKYAKNGGGGTKVNELTISSEELASIPTRFARLTGWLTTSQNYEMGVPLTKTEAHSI